MDTHDFSKKILKAIDTTEMARLLYCNNDATKFVTILDGTYIYTCNTKNYTHQRKIYSGQKHRHLFKVMKLIVAENIYGPFPANKNDAEIISIVFNTFPIEIFSDRGTWFSSIGDFVMQSNF